MVVATEEGARVLSLQMKELRFMAARHSQGCGGGKRAWSSRGRAERRRTSLLLALGSHLLVLTLSFRIGGWQGVRNKPI